MEKFISGGVSATVHGLVTYNVVGENKKTTIDEGNFDIDISRENIRLDDGHYVTRLKITNKSGTMMKLINAYPFICDDFNICNIPSQKWLVINGTRQKNDVPSACCLGTRDEAFFKCTDRLSDEGIVLSNQADGDAIISGDGITMIKAGNVCVSISMLTSETQLCDISLSVDCNGSLKAIRAGGDFNCLLEPGDVKTTEWVGIDVGGNFIRMIDEYADNKKATSMPDKPQTPPCLAYMTDGENGFEGIRDALSFVTYVNAPVDYFVIGNGWQNRFGDWEANDKFSANMQREAGAISSFGYKPGIWTAPFLVERESEFCAENKQLLLRHADGSVCTQVIDDKTFCILDVSSVEAIEWLEMTYQRISAYGYYYHNVDYTDVFMLQKDIVLADPTITQPEAYCRAIQTIKRAIGDDGHLHIAKGYFDCLGRSADSVEICSDLNCNSDSNNFDDIINQVVFRNHMNKWWSNCCSGIICKDNLVKMNLTEQKKALVCAYLCGGTLSIKDLSTNDEVKLLRHVYPLVSISGCSRNIFESMPYVDVADVEVNKNWHTLCFFNHSNDEVALSFRLDNSTCGGYVDHASEYDVASFFGKKYVRNANYDDIISLGKIASNSVEIVKIARSDKPHIILTDSHFSFGGEVGLQIVGDCIKICGENYFNCKLNYMVALPKNMLTTDNKNEFSFSVNGIGKFNYEKRVKFL